MAQKKAVRLLYGGFLLVLAYLTLLVAWKNAQDHRLWSIGDWLISYQAGFVRRGWMGEVLYHLSQNFQVDPAYLAAGLQVLLVWLYMGLAYLALLRQPDWRPYLLLLTSPYLFAFHLLDRTGGLRKELLFFALLAGLVWVALRWPHRITEATSVVLVLYPILTLSHEMLFLLLPYVLLPLAWHTSNSWRHPRILLLLAWNVGAFLLVLFFRGSSEQAEGIVQSLQEFHPWRVEGAFAALDDPLRCIPCRIFREHGWRPFTFHVRAWGLILIAFSWLTERWRRFWRRQEIRLIALSGVLMSIPLFLVAEDWGRWVYIHAVAWFLISLLDTTPLKFEVRPRSVYFTLILFSLAYGLFWRLHHVDGFAWSLPPKDNLRLLWKMFRDLHSAFWSEFR